MSTIYQNLSYSDSVALYAALFIPNMYVTLFISNMYVTSLTSEQKLNILSMVFGNSVRAFREEVVAHHIACIIGDHTNPVNMELLQKPSLQSCWTSAIRRTTSSFARKRHRRTRRTKRRSRKLWGGFPPPLSGSSRSDSS
ncbi:hypothetical protein DVH05_012779 [Phytophthora capsici]|nr:hypothetical protein DVH05_012779 [Phytophthora capsici]